MANLTYYTSLTEQKQRGYIVANEYGGPLDIGSWVELKANLQYLPNQYEGKYAFVFEENEYYVCTNGNAKTWEPLCKDVIVKNGNQFEVLVDGQSDYSVRTTPGRTSSLTIPSLSLSVCASINVGGGTFKYKIAQSSIEWKYQIDNPDAAYVSWSNGGSIDLRNRGVLDRPYKGRIWFTATLTGTSERNKVIARKKIDYIADGVLNQFEFESTTYQNELFWMTSNSTQLQRGIIITSDGDDSANGGSGPVDVTSIVSSLADLSNSQFSNLYPGKLVYSNGNDSEEEGYYYYALTGPSILSGRVTDSSGALKKLDRIIELKDRYAQRGKLAWTKLTKHKYHNDASVYVTVSGPTSVSISLDPNERFTKCTYTATAYVEINGVKIDVSSKVKSWDWSIDESQVPSGDISRITPNGQSYIDGGLNGRTLTVNWTNDEDTPNTFRVSCVAKIDDDSDTPSEFALSNGVSVRVNARARITVDSFRFEMDPLAARFNISSAQDEVNDDTKFKSYNLVWNLYKYGVSAPVKTMRDALGTSSAVRSFLHSIPHTSAIFGKYILKLEIDKNGSYSTISESNWFILDQSITSGNITPESIYVNDLGHHIHIEAEWTGKNLISSVNAINDRSASTTNYGSGKSNWTSISFEYDGGPFATTTEKRFELTYYEWNESQSRILEKKTEALVTTITRPEISDFSYSYSYNCISSGKLIQTSTIRLIDSDITPSSAVKTEGFLQNNEGIGSGNPSVLLNGTGNVSFQYYADLKEDGLTDTASKNNRISTSIKSFKMIRLEARIVPNSGDVLDNYLPDRDYGFHVEVTETDLSTNRQSTPSIDSISWSYPTHSMFHVTETSYGGTSDAGVNVSYDADYTELSAYLEATVTLYGGWQIPCEISLNLQNPVKSVVLSHTIQKSIGNKQYRQIESDWTLFSATVSLANGVTWADVTATGDALVSFYTSTGIKKNIQLVSGSYKGSNSSSAANTFTFRFLNASDEPEVDTTYYLLFNTCKSNNDTVVVKKIADDSQILINNSTDEFNIDEAAGVEYSFNISINGANYDLDYLSVSDGVGTSEKRNYSTYMACTGVYNSKSEANYQIVTKTISYRTWSTTKTKQVKIHVFDNDDIDCSYGSQVWVNGSYHDLKDDRGNWRWVYGGSIKGLISVFSPSNPSDEPFNGVRHEYYQNDYGSAVGAQAYFSYKGISSSYQSQNYIRQTHNVNVEQYGIAINATTGTSGYVTLKAGFDGNTPTNATFSWEWSFRTDQVQLVGGSTSSDTIILKSLIPGTTYPEVHCNVTFWTWLSYDAYVNLDGAQEYPFGSRTYGIQVSASSNNRVIQDTSYRIWDLIDHIRVTDTTDTPLEIGMLRGVNMVTDGISFQPLSGISATTDPSRGFWTASSTNPRIRVTLNPNNFETGHAGPSVYEDVTLTFYPSLFGLSVNDYEGVQDEALLTENADYTFSQVSLTVNAINAKYAIQNNNWTSWYYRQIGNGSWGSSSTLLSKEELLQFINSNIKKDYTLTKNNYVVSKSCIAMSGTSDTIFHLGIGDIDQDEEGNLDGGSTFWTCNYTFKNSLGTISSIAFSDAWVIVGRTLTLTERAVIFTFTGTNMSSDIVTFTPVPSDASYNIVYNHTGSAASGTYYLVNDVYTEDGGYIGGTIKANGKSESAGGHIRLIGLKGLSLEWLYFNSDRSTSEQRLTLWSQYTNHLPAAYPNISFSKDENPITHSYLNGESSTTNDTSTKLVYLVDDFEFGKENTEEVYIGESTDNGSSGSVYSKLSYKVLNAQVACNVIGKTASYTSAPSVWNATSNTALETPKWCVHVWFRAAISALISSGPGGWSHDSTLNGILDSLAYDSTRSKYIAYGQSIKAFKVKSGIDTEVGVFAESTVSAQGKRMTVFGLEPGGGEFYIKIYNKEKKVWLTSPIVSYGAIASCHMEWSHNTYIIDTTGDMFTSNGYGKLEYYSGTSGSHGNQTLRCVLKADMPYVSDSWVNDVVNDATARVYFYINDSNNTANASFYELSPDYYSSTSADGVISSATGVEKVMPELYLVPSKPGSVTITCTVRDVANTWTVNCSNTATYWFKKKAKITARLYYVEGRGESIGIYFTRSIDGHTSPSNAYFEFEYKITYTLNGATLTWESNKTYDNGQKGNPCKFTPGSNTYSSGFIINPNYAHSNYYSPRTFVLQSLEIISTPKIRHSATGIDLSDYECLDEYAYGHLTNGTKSSSSSFIEIVQPTATEALY